MLFNTFSAAVFGIDAYLVEVEVDVVPAFSAQRARSRLPAPFEPRRELY